MFKKQVSVTKKRAKGRKMQISKNKGNRKEEMFDLTLNKIAEYIRTRAYYIWEDMGKPEGKDVEIWHKAEKDILSSLIKK